MIRRLKRAAKRNLRRRRRPDRGLFARCYTNDTWVLNCAQHRALLND